MEIVALLAGHMKAAWLMVMSVQQADVGLEQTDTHHRQTVLGKWLLHITDLLLAEMHNTHDFI
jgi:hypothetical protein